MELLPVIILILGVCFIAAGFFLKNNENSQRGYNSSENFDTNEGQFTSSLEKIQQKLDSMGINVNEKTSDSENIEVSPSSQGNGNISEEKLDLIAIENKATSQNATDTKPRVGETTTTAPISIPSLADTHYLKDQMQSLSQNSKPRPVEFTSANVQQSIPVNHADGHLPHKKTPQASSKMIYVSHENPKLYKKEAHLYLDSSNRNSYTGLEDNFAIDDVLGIRRFGNGNLSYDGYHFFFEHETGTEKFNLDLLDHIAFYPNCVVLVPKSDLPCALFFIDETNSLRQVLTSFQLDNDN